VVTAAALRRPAPPVPGRAGLVALAAAAGLAGGCERIHRSEEVDRAEIAVSSKVTLRTDTVGHDEWAATATFALVDADNLGDRAAAVTLGGVLVDGDGHEVGRLRPEVLRIPAHGRRTFALVDDDKQVRAAAVTARVDVRGALRPRFEDPVHIDEGHVWDDYGKVVVTGMVVNTADRGCRALVLAGFHDGDGRPMTRPFALFEIGPHQERSTRFVGPQGSRTGYVFLGPVKC